MSQPLYLPFLERIAELKRQYSRPIQAPCSPAALQALRDRAVSELHSDVPDGYLRFLLACDGLDWDGVVVFASRTSAIGGYVDRFIPGFVESNLAFRESEHMSQYLVFGESWPDLLVFDSADSTYALRDAVAMDLNEQFPSFESMLNGVLKKLLGPEP